MGWRATLALLAALLVCTAQCIPDAVANIHLRSGTLRIDARSVRDNWRSLAATGQRPAVPPSNDPQPYFVSYRRPSARSALRTYLQAHGATIVSFIPDSTWLVYAVPDAVAGALEEGLAVSVAPCEPEHKIAPEWAGLAKPSTWLGDGGGLGSNTEGAGPDGTAQLAADGGGAGAAPDFAAVLDGKVVKYVITAQLFCPACTSAAALALAASRAAAWLTPLAASLLAPAQPAAPPAAAAPSCPPALRARGRLLQAVVCAPDVAGALAWLAARPEVHWLEPTPRLVRRDVWGALVVQAGGLGVGAAALAQPTAAGAHPFWSRGLDGTSQLVGISDSGVDMDSCYFFDPKIPDVWRRLTPDPARRSSRVFKSTTHRKLASYYAYTDFGDADGHGTHVSGIALGACYGSSSNGTASMNISGRSVAARVAKPPPPGPPPPATGAIVSARKKQPPPDSRPVPLAAQPASSPPPPTDGGSLPYKVDEATGMAPGAKLAFYDIMDKNRIYDLPSYEDILQYQMGSGVFVQSDSWGSKETFWYNTLCQQLDDFTWRNPQMLVLTAAGNDGATFRSAPNGTVSAPANAKNTLSVGSTLSVDAGTADDGTLWLHIWTGDPEPPSAQPLVVAALSLEPGASDAGGGGDVSSYGSVGRSVDAAADGSGQPADPAADQQGEQRGWRRRRLQQQQQDAGGGGGAGALAASPATQPPQPSAGPAPPSLTPAAALPGPPAAAPPPAALNELVQLPAAQDFRTLRALEGVVLEAVAAEPPTGCRTLTNGAATAAAAGSGLPKLVVALRGECMYYVKALTAAAAGGAAVAIVNNAPGGMQLQVNSPNVSIPAAPLSGDVGGRLLAALAAGRRVFAVAAWRPLQPSNNVAAWSAYGPTSDRRIKPDVVAPGKSVLSAYTDRVSAGLDDRCANRMRLDGTSMSAPLVAGAAALARQYFTAGFYPLGHNSTPGSAPFTPSGMLLKAVLVGGAYDMQGMSMAALQQLQPAPSAYQGFGRVDLAAALPLSAADADAAAPPFPFPAPAPPRASPPPAAPASCAAPRLQLVDMVGIVDGAVHSYRVGATGEGAVVVTLVWMDPPADMMAAVALINNLDLEAVLAPAARKRSDEAGAGAAAAAAVTYWGNAGWVAAGGANNGTGGGGTGAARDDRNNVERVTVPAGAAGALSINVHATALNSQFVTRFAADTQRYALTVQGCFTGFLVSSSNPDPRAQPPSPPPSPPPPPAPVQERVVPRCKKGAAAAGCNATTAG